MPGGGFPSTSSEEELLLECARMRLDPGSAFRFKSEFREEIRWEDLFHLARQHGLLPLLHQSLNTRPHGEAHQAVPTHFQDRLRRYFEENARRNLLLTGELLRIIRFLRRHGIQAIPFKGPISAVSIYGDLALRQFADLDLLIRPGGFEKAVTLLTSDGYQPLLSHPRGKSATRLQLDYEYDLIRRDDRVHLDIHRRIVPDPFYLPFDYESLWRQTQPLLFGDMEIQTLCAEDLLSVLCIHGAKDRWLKLEWVLAVGLLVGGRKRLDWERVMRQVSVRGGERLHLLGFRLAHDLLGVPLPAEVARRVQSDSPTQRLAREIETDFFRTRNCEGVLTKLKFFFELSEGMGGKVKFLCHLGFVLMRPTEKEWRLLRLPGWLFPLYYLIRPLRLVARYGRGIFRGKAGDAEGEI